MGKMECKLHVTLKIGIQGFTQEATEVPVVLCCPLHPSAGKRRHISPMTRGRIVAFEKKMDLQNGVCRVSADTSRYARGPHLSQADGSPDLPPLCSFHVVLVR